MAAKIKSEKEENKKSHVTPITGYYIITPIIGYYIITTNGSFVNI